MDHFSRGGLRFPVRDEGPRDGDVVALLHGFPQGPSAYEEVVPLLHDRGLRTLVPTMRGYAESARPSRRRDYSWSQTTADLLALLDAAGAVRAHVVGHDWGAAPAWAAAAWHPDRVASLTVLSTPHPGAMSRSLVTSSQGLKSWYMAFFQIPVLPERMALRTLRSTLTGSGLPEEHADAYVAAMQQPGALSAAMDWYRGIPFSLRPAVGDVRVPTTYVWGVHDFALGRSAAERTRDHVFAAYRFVEVDAGHWLPETRPAEVAAAVLERAGR